MFDSRIGEEFTVSNIGNQVSSGSGTDCSIKGSVAYPLECTAATRLVVIGHTDCGAITAAYKWLAGDRQELSCAVERAIEPLVDGLQSYEKLVRSEGLTDAQKIARLAERNVDHQIDRVKAYAPHILVYGMMYDLNEIYGDDVRGYITNLDGDKTPGGIAVSLEPSFKRIS
jgi:carbonic anhydrase